MSEARRVGAGHHRKTSRACSIDWSLPPTDFATENQQQQEQVTNELEGHDTNIRYALARYGYFKVRDYHSMHFAVQHFSLRPDKQHFIAIVSTS